MKTENKTTKCDNSNNDKCIDIRNHNSEDLRQAQVMQ